MKLASLKGPTHDGTLLLVNANLTHAVNVADIAPTMLAMMGLAIPPEMTGESLIAR